MLTLTTEIGGIVNDGGNTSDMCSGRLGKFAGIVTAAYFVQAVLSC